MRLPIAAVIATLLLSGCDPQFDPGTAPNPGSGNRPAGPPPEPAEPIHMTSTLSVSSSATDPHANQGAAVAGPVDLYLWLVQTTHPVSAMEFDIRRDGAELAPTYFTAAGLSLWLTWESGGDVDLAIAGCPAGTTLLGTIHLEASGDPMTVAAMMDSPEAGAVDCIEFAIHPFTCTPYIAD